MKNTILLLVVAIFIKTVSCNESILSKHHQHIFKLKDVRIQLMSYNKENINFFEIIAFKYNRTTTAHNLTINLKVNSEGTSTKVYKFLSNEYRHFPNHYQVNAEKAFESNAIGLRGLTTCGNVTSFRFRKDITYRSCNFVIDETQFPPLMPNGKYLLELTIIHLDKEMAVINVYHEIYTPIKYPKN